MIYKVLKDFPSMRAGTEYKKGETVRLEMNGRTKSLIEMGYIENVSEIRDDTTTITEAICKTGRFDEVKTRQCGKGCFKVWVENKC